MFDVSNYSNSQEVHINAVSGTLVKNYKDSFIDRFSLNSRYARTVLSDNPRIVEDSGIEKPIVVLQVMVCGDMEVMAEIMWKEDFDKLFDSKRGGKNHEESNL